jgi:predicted AAA+ superfamily ATPase
LCRHFAPQLRSFLLQRLAFGSYPEVVTTDKPVQLLRELASDYLWKDILQAGMVKIPDLIKRLLLLLAHQAGAEVSTNELATQLQMASPTVDRYLDLLQQTFVIFRLPSFSTNPRKEIAKSQKVFFWDTGIRNALLN